MHRKKRKELQGKEYEACLEKLDEINTKIEKGNKNMSEHIEEKLAYLKTQSLIFELKKEQARKLLQE